MRFSSKKRAPSPSPSTASTKIASNTRQSTHPPRREPSPRNNNNDSQILSLTLENSSLKSQLSSLLDSTEAGSNAELANLLQLSNEKNDSLQQKVDELHTGLLEIEKERRLLKSSVERDREGHRKAEQRYIEEIEAARSLLTEESKRVESLEGQLNELVEVAKELEDQKKYLSLKEKELAVLQSRVGEQERRIEVLNEEGMELKKVIESLRGDKSKLESENADFVNELEGMKEKMAEVQAEVARGQEREDKLAGDLAAVKEALEAEKMNHKADRIDFDAKESQWRDELDSAMQAKKQKDETIDEISKSLTATKEEQQQLQQTLDEKNLEITSLQHDINKLQGDMEQMSIAHEEVVSEKDAEVQSWKEQKQSLDAELALAKDASVKMEDEIQSQIENNNALSSKCDALDKTNGKLSQEVEKTRQIITRLESEFENTREQVDVMQRREADLKDELAEMKQRFSVSQDDVHKLNSQIDEIAAAHQDETAKVSKEMMEVESELKSEVATCNELRSELEKMNLQSKQDAKIYEEALDNIEAQLKEEQSRHHDEVGLLKSEHAAQVEELETNGAAVITDMEDSIGALKKEISHNKIEHEQAVNKLNQTISQANTQKEMLERQLQEQSKMIESQEEKIGQLNNLSQHRGEEIIALQKELTSHRDALDIANRDHSAAITAISNEMEDAQLNHQQEMNEIGLTVNDLRSQLAAANAKLDAEDYELNATKSKLTERTQILKDMIERMKADKADYEQECSRTKQLSETLERCKSELNEAKSKARQHEREKDNQESRYQEILRKERQQRKAIEKQLESLDAVKKKYNEMEKENVNLKDKISRQENYIGKLHDKQERDRRRSTAPLGVSKGNRPSTAPMSPPRSHISTHRGSGVIAKKRHHTAQELMQGQLFSSSASVSFDSRQNENENPKHMMHQSADESDLTLG